MTPAAPWKVLKVPAFHADSSDHAGPASPIALGTVNRLHVRERPEAKDKALLKLCPFCGQYVHGRAESLHKARIALRNAMVRHVLDAHPEDS